MSIWDFFKKKKEHQVSSQKINLNDDVYIDEEMKTFNPEQEESDDLTLDTMTETLNTTSTFDQDVVRTNVHQQLNQQAVQADFEPVNYNDIQKAAWMLQHAKKVVLSVEKMSPTDRSKTLNFFAGMIYALDGSVKQLTKNSFLFETEKKHS